MAELSSYPKLIYLAGTEQLILDNAAPVTKNITAINLANTLATLASGVPLGNKLNMEFTAGDAAPAWTPSAPAITDIGVTIPSRFYVHTTDSALRYALWSYVLSGAFDAQTQFGMALDGPVTVTGLGLYLADSNNLNAVMLLGAANTVATFSMTGYTFSGGVYTSFTATINITGTHIYARLKRDTANNITAYISTDGLLWVFLATVNFSFTASQIGYRLSTTASTPVSIVSDWLRVS